MLRLGVRSVLLAAFLVAGGTPILVFWMWPQSAALQSEKEEAHERHLLLAQNLSASLDRYHDDVVRAFEDFSLLLAQGRTFRATRNQLAALHFRHFCIIDPATGAVEEAYEIVRGSALTQPLPASLPWLRALAAKRDLRLSPVLITSPGAEPQFLIARMIGDKLAIASVGTVHVRELAGQIEWGEKGHAAVVDRDGRVIAHPRAEWAAEARDLSALDPVRRMLQGQSGVSTFHSPALGAVVIAGYTQAPGPGWGVMVPQPVAELTAKAERMANSTLLVFLSSLALSTLLALAFANRFAQGLDAVTEAARGMARGEHGVRAPARALRHAVAEVQTLGLSFNHMAQQVEEAHDRIVRMAETDRLTGLLNRGAFVERANEAMSGPEGAPNGTTLYFIDVDHFKVVNDAYGHAFGDALLQHLADVLRQVAGADDLIGRLSGDELLLMHQRKPTTDDRSHGRALLRALSAPTRIRGQSYRPSCSIGACVTSPGGVDFNTALSRADKAMYRAKNRGRGCLSFFDRRLQNEDETRRDRIRALDEAIQSGAIYPMFQPIFNARTGQLSCFEALARWRGPKGLETPPQKFIAMAEETGLIAELDRQMREHAIRLAQELRRRGVFAPIAVNLSWIDLAQHGFVPQLEAALAKAELPPSALVLEITEGVFEGRGNLSLEAMIKLRDRGFTLALDDFGKGAVSIDFLLKLPVERMKIDKKFAGDIATDEKARAATATMIELGKRLNLHTTLEGIETVKGERFAHAMGVDDVQGNLFCIPLDYDAAVSFGVSRRPQLRAVGSS